MTPTDEKKADEILLILQKIPDAYPDFVRYTPTEIVLEGLADDFTDYVNANSELTTSDVLEWIVDKAGWESEASG